MDRRPRYTVSDAELKWRDQFFADHGSATRASSACSRTPMRRTATSRTCGRSSRRSRSRRACWCSAACCRPTPGILRVIQVQGLDVRRAFALASGCDVLVTPDSVFFHLAGALDLPCVGLFGPTDGRVRGQDYPRARIAGCAADAALRAVLAERGDAVRSHGPAAERLPRRDRSSGRRPCRARVGGRRAAPAASRGLTDARWRPRWTGRRSASRGCTPGVNCG